MSDELKPCPFCGGTDLILTTAMGESWVFCKNRTCGATCSGHASTPEKAIDAWNTRFESDELPEWVKEAIENEVGQNLNKRSQLFYCGFVQALNWVLSLRKPEAHS